MAATDGVDATKRVFWSVNNVIFHQDDQGVGLILHRVCSKTFARPHDAVYYTVRTRGVKRQLVLKGLLSTDQIPSKHRIIQSHYESNYIGEVETEYPTLAVLLKTLAIGELEDIWEVLDGPGI